MRRPASSRTTNGPNPSPNPISNPNPNPNPDPNPTPNPNQNAIHHTYNRAVVIHGVHYLRVQNNVAFETMGNTFFVEDGIETKNVITHNLGANTRQSFAGLTVDQTPATYWFVNPDNYVASNIAAGSTHYGLWFFPEPKVRGASEFEPGSDQVCPQGTPLLWFADNEAHHCGS